MPYVYELKFLPTNQIYIGYRCSKNCTPSDLMRSYFTSSKLIHKLIDEYGLASFSYRILEEFTDGNDAYKFEQSLLEFLDVESNEMLLNKRLTSKPNYDFKNHTEKSKLKMSESRTEIWKDPNFKEKMQKIMKESWETRDKSVYKTDKFRELKRQNTEELWKDPIYVESVMSAHSIAVNEQSYKDFHSEHKKKLWQDSDYRTRQCESRKRNMTAERRAEISRRSKEMWANSEFKEKTLAERRERNLQKKKLKELTFVDLDI